MTNSHSPSSADIVELQPCPFCGGEAGYYASGEAVFKMNWIGHVCHCKSCQARVSTTAGSAAAAAMWNARALTAIHITGRPAQPVAWRYRHHGDPWSVCDTEPEDVEPRRLEVQPLYAAHPPAAPVETNTNANPAIRSTATATAIAGDDRESMETRPLKVASPEVGSPPQCSAATEGVRLSNWLADYSHDLKEEGDFDQEAAQLDRASQWIADHLNAVPQAAWQCAARKQGTMGGNAPADCDWPGCGCDPVANKVLEAIDEAGFEITKKPEPTPWDAYRNRSYEPVETLAKEIYDTFVYNGPPGTTKPEWTPGGNGTKQDEAREDARLRLRVAGHTPALSRPHRGSGE